MIKKKLEQFEIDLLDYLINDKSIIDTINSEMGIKSTVISDFDNKKRYAFFGSGCGMSWISFDARSKTANALFGKNGIAYNVIKQYKQKLLTDIMDKNTIQYFNSVGFPFEATLYQNLKINTCILDSVLTFTLTKFNIKRIYIQTRID